MPCVFLSPQDASAAVGDLGSNAALPGAAQASGMADPHGAAAVETGGAVAAVLADTAADGDAAVASTVGGSSAMNKKLAFQKVKSRMAKSFSGAAGRLHCAGLHAQELDDFNNASRGRMD
jgi:hypothetical protein